MLKEYFLYLLTCDGCGAQKPSQTDKSVPLSEVKFPKGWKESCTTKEHFCKPECFDKWFEKNKETEKQELNPYK
ncbi:MAG TPA: hypothetical protein ENI08_02225 [Candidatus Dependentiae bacterium]|nr:hypothetical protein [Candidatus Dependentiae bacterium]